jgi:serine phosphatase RsbU (regulator of sigma subunit)
MESTTIASHAFRRAVLQSERLRILGLLAVLTLIVGFGLVRDLVPHQEQALRVMNLRRALPISCTLAAYELMMLALVNRALRRDTEPPSWLWSLNVVTETLAPTFVLLVATFSPYPGPYRALVSPALLAYLLFSILATLRLSPWLCLLTGLSGAGGYMVVVAITFDRFPEPPPASAPFAFTVYLTFAVFLLLGGAAAAAVSRQIRSSVLAALREAETRQQVEQLEHDLEIARDIQQGLLPRCTPRLNGFDIAGWSRPADQTGGDYYDWQELSDDCLVVSLADVTGHGIGPALVTAVCRAYARASFLGQEELGRLVDRLHSLLAEDLPSSRFVTFVAVVLQERVDRLQMVSAGHGPILLYSARENLLHARDADGLPLGVMPEIPYAPAQEVAFLPGDILVLITDGFFEWTNAQGEQYGTDRLCQSVRSVRELPAAEMIQRIYADVLEFTAGTEQSDDLTIVVIKRD